MLADPFSTPLQPGPESRIPFRDSAQSVSDSSVSAVPMPLPAVGHGPWAAGVDSSHPQNWPEIPGYLIQAHLGDGSFGSVYRAHAVRLNAQVAIKVVWLSREGGQDLIRRFAQEVSAAARNRHPNVVQVLDSEVLSGSGAARFAFLVTEYLSGGTLRDWLQAHPRTSSSCEHLTEGVRKVLQICSGLQSLHEMGVVHRDIKPANILLDQYGNAKLGDFGLCSVYSQDIAACEGSVVGETGLVSPETSRMTLDGELMGTLCYMSPELMFSSQRVVPASDQYAVGLMLYELICGLRPRQRFSGDPEERLRLVEELELVRQGRTPTAIPKPALRGRVRSRNLQRICLRCLQAEPSQRYGSVSELARDLERWLNGEQPGGGLLTELWNARLIRPMHQHPVRSLLTVCAGWCSAMIIYHYSVLLEREGETEERLRQSLQIVNQLNIEAGEKKLVLGQMQDLVRSILEMVTKLAALTVAEGIADMPDARQLRSLLLSRLADDCSRILQSDTHLSQKRELLQGRLSRLVQILQQTGELNQARSVGRLLLKAGDECIPDFSDFSSSLLQEYFVVAGLLADIELDSQDGAAADLCLQLLEKRLSAAPAKSAESLTWQADLERRRSRRHYLRYTQTFVRDRQIGQSAVLAAEASAKKEIQLRKELLLKCPGPSSAVELCRAQGSLALYQYKNGKALAAIATQTEAMNALQTLADDQQVGEAAIQQYSRISFNGVMPLRSVGRMQDALHLGEQGLQMSERLVERYPLVLRYQQELGRGHGNQAETLALLFQHHDVSALPVCVQHLQSAAEIYLSVHQRDPGRQEARITACIQLLRLTVFSCVAGNHENARQAFCRAVEVAAMEPAIPLHELEPGNGINAVGALVGRELTATPGASDRNGPPDDQICAVWTEPDRLVQDARPLLHAWPDLERRLTAELGDFPAVKLANPGP
ncbi:MAG: serine/threonine-protein kinase [Planctomycetota bacterium]